MIVLVIWIIFAVIGVVMGESRSVGKGGGLILGFLLGPIGLLIIALSGKASPSTNEGSYDNNYNGGM